MEFKVASLKWRVFKKNYHKTRILAATSHITFSCLHSPSGVRFLRPIPQAQKNSSKKLLKKNRKNAKMSLLDGSGMAWRAGGYPSIFFHHFFLSLPIVFTINLPLRPDCSKMNIRPTLLLPTKTFVDTLLHGLRKVFNVRAG